MKRVAWLLLLLALGWLATLLPAGKSPKQTAAKREREEVIFWHFWGGADREAVEDVVERFNASQDRYLVRAIAMPGNNLDVKLFLAITGGDPPDLVNQDDPIVADWASREALMGLDEIAGEAEIEALREWLFPAARRLGEYDDRLFALCNGLDIRALFVNETMLESYGLQSPRRRADLDRIALTIAPPEESDRDHVGYLPDSRRLWAWGYVHGGRFIDADNGAATLTDPAIVEALEWMVEFSRRYGAEEVAAFRAGDQSLPGKVFPLLPVEDDSMFGRYAVLMDGQWRCRDIESFMASRERRGLPSPRFGVAPLPSPEGGLENAGWVNGNFFVVPRGSRSPHGAWEFMKFWCGFDGNESQAADTCMSGGWIPVSDQVVSEPRFQNYLRDHPLFAEFVRLAASDEQHPIPVIAGAPFLNREVKDVAERAMNDPATEPSKYLQRAEQRVREHLERINE